MKTFLTLLLAAGLATACGKPAVGDRCSASDTYCDGSTEMFCDMSQGGTIRAIPCKGPAACGSQDLGGGPVVQCDTSGNVAGDACKGDESFCSGTDKLTCDPSTNTMKSETCSSGCSVDGGQAFCS